MELKTKTNLLVKEVQTIVKNLKLDELQKNYEKLLIKSQQPDFWNDTAKAQEHMKRLGKLQGRIDPWQQLQKQLAETSELASMNDSSLESDLAKQIEKIEKTFGVLKKELSFSGPYDDHDVVLNIYAGAGGTDAQDWAGMLARMYTRWAESHKIKTSILEESAGEEAGLKSISIDMKGNFLYGKLKGEHGVHRLVRLSPYNANNLRQTSFAKVEVLPKIDEPEAVPLDEKDLKVDVFRAGGHGGQSVNTTDSAVRVTHLPTGLVVSIQNERSQLQNKETALTILRSKLAVMLREQHQENIAELKGPNQSAEWGSQIRSYVLHPYTMVKDLRTRHETSNAEAILDGNLDSFIDAYLESQISQE